MFASWAGMVDCEGRWWHQKSPYLLCSSGLALAGTWTLQNVWGCCSCYTCLHHGLAWLTVRAVDDTKNHLTYFVRVLALAGTWTLQNVWGCCNCCTCLHHGLAWLTVRAGYWRHQKSPYLLCSSGLALAGTWTLQNVWGCCSCCTCLHHGLAWLTVRAVDDTKNHLTYFLRVDWHLPGRELSRMSKVAVVVAHVCIMGWHSWLWGPLMTPKITLPTLFEWDSHLTGRELSRMSEVAVVVAHVCIMGWHGWLWGPLMTPKNHLTYFVRVDWHLPGRELSRMSEVAVVVAHVCIMGWHDWVWAPLMTPKITLPTLFEWTGTCRDVNSPDCLRLL